MPLYVFRDEENNDVLVRASWKDVQGLSSAPADEVVSFLLGAEDEKNLMTDVPIRPDGIYHRVMCAPSLQFKGGGWGCSQD